MINVYFHILWNIKNYPPNFNTIIDVSIQLLSSKISKSGHTYTWPFGDCYISLIFFCLFLFILHVLINIVNFYLHMIFLCYALQFF